MPKTPFSRFLGPFQGGFMRSPTFGLQARTLANAPLPWRSQVGQALKPFSFPTGSPATQVGRRAGRK